MSTLAACPGCVAAPPAPIASDGPADIVLSLPGIHCAACIGKVERTLHALPGVSSARVNLSRRRVAITARDASPERLVAALDAAGFEAHPLDTRLVSRGDDAYGRDLMIRLAVAGFAMMNVMLLSVSVWSGADGATRDLFHLISAAISVPAVLYAAQPFFVSAARAVRAASLNMDVPIALAILLAAGMSLYESLQGGQHAYFDAALSLTFFLLIGRVLDHKTRAAARSAAKDLSALEVHTTQRLTDGQALTVAVAELQVGDRLLIATGSRVPVDGILESAGASTDRSFLTGETAAVRLRHGDTVQAGEINLGAPITLTATAVGEDTTLRRVAALVETAENSRNSYTALADRAARIYAPAVHLLALAAFMGWMAATGDARLALNIAVAVLIITCPCALGLAVPAVATAAIGKLYGLGFLVKDGTALERLAEVDLVVFDKTGTLTLPGVAAGCEGLSMQEKSVALALAQASDHPVSRAIATALGDSAPAEVTDVQEHPGCGVQAVADGTTVRLGRGGWLGADFDGVGLRIGDEPARAIPLHERLRDGAREAVAALKTAGLPVMMISGDRPAAVADIAGMLGIDQHFAGVDAEGKHARLRALKADGRRVLMVGDGLNDAAALAAAHASLAPSSALDASRNAADIVMLGGSMAGLGEVLGTARRAMALSRENFAIAGLYNLVAVPVALAGFATPLLAALAMSTSSITVLLNALRVRRPS